MPIKAKIKPLEKPKKKEIWLCTVKVTRLKKKSSEQHVLKEIIIALNPKDLDRIKNDKWWIKKMARRCINSEELDNVVDQFKITDIKLDRFLTYSNINLNE